MLRRLTTIGAGIIPLIAYVLLTAGCGGDAGVSVSNPAPGATPGPAVSGTVLMPNGQVAGVNASLLERFASLVIEKAMALTGSVSPVGRNTPVTLVRLMSNGIAQAGSSTTYTFDDAGHYIVHLPENTTADTCRYMVSVGDKATSSLTRALVFSTSAPVDIDFRSEAAVRVILARVEGGADLCDFSLSDIEAITKAVGRAQGTASGANAGQLNFSAEFIAEHDDIVRQTLDAALGTPTAGPTSTGVPQDTATPTATLTASVRPPTATPSKTASPLPSNTPGATSTRSNTPEASSTATSTRSNTPTNTATATRTNTPTSTVTNTLPPSATPTNTATATNTATKTFTPTATASSTATSTNSATATATHTATATATNTATATATNTPAATNTATVTATTGIVPAVNLSSTSGSPGGNVVITGTLVNGGNQLAGTSDDIFYDLTQVNVVLNASSKADCTINPAIGPGTAADKGLQTSISAGPQANLKKLRVGVIGLNQNTIPNGLLFTCNFHIESGAGAGDQLLQNTATGTDPNSIKLTVIGGNGTITVQTAPAATATPTTPAPTNTPVPPSATATTGADAPAVNLSSTSGSPGGNVVITGTLVNGGNQLAGTSDDIFYDLTQVNVVLNASSKASCTINPAIGPGTAADKGLQTSISAGPQANLKKLRVGVIGLNQNTIPDGLLFTCNFHIESGASDGDQLLQNTATGTDPNSIKLTVSGGNGIIGVQTGGAPTNTPTPPMPTETPTAIATSTAVATNTPVPPTTSPTATIVVPTLTPTSGVTGPAVNLSSTSGSPGGNVVLTGTLVNGGNQLAGTSDDIFYDLTQVNVVLNASSKASCTINPAIGPGTAADKGLQTSISAGPQANLKKLRVGVIGLNQNTIPDGLLFTCNFHIESGAGAGDQLLQNTATGTDPNSIKLTVTGGNGTITVVQ